MYFQQIHCFVHLLINILHSYFYQICSILEPSCDITTGLRKMGDRMRQQEAGISQGILWNVLSNSWMPLKLK